MGFWVHPFEFTSKIKMILSVSVPSNDGKRESFANYAQEVEPRCRATKLHLAERASALIFAYGYGRA